MTKTEAESNKSAGPLISPVRPMENGKQVCPCCERRVNRTYKMAWYGADSIEKLDFPCYACKFNVFPPNHELFEKVQRWRAERHLSVRTPKPDEVVLAEAGSPGPQNPEWLRVRDEQQVTAAADAQRAGQVAPRIDCEGCGRAVERPVIAVVLSLDDGKMVRRVAWLHEACVAEANERRREMYAQLVRAQRPVEWRSTGGAELLGYWIPNRGRFTLDQIATLREMGGRERMVVEGGDEDEA